MVYVVGNHSVICDLCGFEYLRSECVKDWRGSIVCKEMCYDGPRHPLEYLVRPKSDRQAVPDARPPKAIAPTITTNEITLLKAAIATCGGQVRNNGGSAVTAQGVCWSTSHAPDTDDDTTDEGAGTNFSCDNDSYATKATCQAAMHAWRENFTSNITGLNAETTYYIRAYATNGEGTGYGPEVEFTTPRPGYIVDPSGIHIVDPSGIPLVEPH